MNLKKKLCSGLSLVLVLCTLMSTVAMALDTTGDDPSTTSANSGCTSNSSAQANQTDQEARNSSSDFTTDQMTTASTGSAQDPSTTTSNDGSTSDTSPDVMSVDSGWTSITVDGKAAFAYQYLDGTTVKTAGSESKDQVLYLPEQTVTVGTGTRVFKQGYYFFQSAYWAETYQAKPALYKKIPVIEQVGAGYVLSPNTQDRALQVKNGVGTLYTGSISGCRYTDGKPYEKFGLGSDHNLYFYVDGKYQTSKSKKMLANGDDAAFPKGPKGYTLFEGKLYQPTDSTLNKMKTSPYAVLFTGRLADKTDKPDEKKTYRRYDNGVPRNGYGLGAEKVPNLYFYIDGTYDSKKSVERIKGKNGYTVYKNKLYYNNGKNIYASLYTGYRTVDSKLYQYTKGTGVLYTGIYKGAYYTKGMKTAKSGWVKISGSWYYFKGGKAVTDWQYLSRNGQTYKYYFRSNGILVEDLFAYFGRRYLSKPMTIKVNRTTHTADILIYDPVRKFYCIAAKSFVCSTCQNSSDFDAGTYHLYQNRRRRWFTFTHPVTNVTSYYQYASFIVGTHSWIHSPSYSKKGNIRSLNVGNYNKLGTNQTFYCVRFQVGNAKTVYDAVGKQGNAKVKVVLYRSDNKGPYGQITLANSTGKLSKSHTYDPTDPAIK